MRADASRGSFFITGSGSGPDRNYPKVKKKFGNEQELTVSSQILKVRANDNEVGSDGRNRWEVEEVWYQIQRRAGL